VTSLGAGEDRGIGLT